MSEIYLIAVILAAYKFCGPSVGTCVAFVCLFAWLFDDKPLFTSKQDRQ